MRMASLVIALILLVLPTFCTLRNPALEQKRINLQNRLQNQRLAEERIEQLRQFVKDIHTHTEEVQKDNDNSLKLFQTAFQSDGKGLRMQIDLRESLEEKRVKLNSCIAVNHQGSFESFLKFLRAVGPCSPVVTFGGATFDKLVFALIEPQFMLFMNHHLKSVTEETLETFIGLMKGYVTLFSRVSDLVDQQDYQSTFLSDIPPDGCPDLAFMCQHLIGLISNMVVSLDHFTQYWDSVALPDVEYYRFDKLYVCLKNVRIISESSIILLFDQFLPRRREYAESNAVLKAEYRDRVRNIRARMDNQFPDDRIEVQEEIIEKKVASAKTFNKRGKKGKKKALKKGNNNGKNRDRSKVTRDALATSSGATPAAEEPKAEAVPEPKVNSHQVRKQEAATKREVKAQAQVEKAKKKHEERVDAINIEEEDDIDVKFYYSMMRPDANRVFNDNQATQACKRVYAASDRFRHSIFPEITASGETINFLCELLVSGTPDYEGFLEAHADLGGEMIEKTNGNKMFFFKDPINYHKTLHRPHLSSDFDHRLYRRFYRNCGLHPYFFVLS